MVPALIGEAAKACALNAMPPGLLLTAGIPTVTAVRPVTVTGNPGAVPTGVLVLMKAVPAHQAQPIPVQALELHLFMTKTPGRVVLNVMNPTYNN